jgi:hypothetical protein
MWPVKKTIKGIIKCDVVQKPVSDTHLVKVCDMFTECPVLKFGKESIKMPCNICRSLFGSNIDKQFTKEFLDKVRDIKKNAKIAIGVDYE